MLTNNCLHEVGQATLKIFLELQLKLVCYILNIPQLENTKNQKIKMIY